MKYNRYLNEIIGLKLLNIKHIVNLTGFVFGLYEEKGQLSDNSYGLQITCPWILSSKRTGMILAASGDLFSPPENFRTLKGKLSQWQTCYTNLDEKLEDVRKEEAFVEEIEFYDCGDLRVLFSNDMELYTFTDFSVEQDGWWFYKCGGAYTAPLQKSRFVEEMITRNDTWWFLKCKGRSMCFCDTDMTQETMSEISGNHSFTRKKCMREPSYEQHLIGGKVVEIGRKKEELLKDAPVTWLKICVPESKNGENNCRTYMIYLYCPWRIRKKDNSEMILATADMRGVLCWDDSIVPFLRKNDFYKEKMEQVESIEMVITDVYWSDRGNVVIEFGELFVLEFFINHSIDAVCWKGYCVGEKAYIEGGKDFLEFHCKPILKGQGKGLQFFQHWMDELISDEVIGISRRGNYYAFLFKRDGSNKCSQMICPQFWRITDTKTENILLGGHDCYYPCTELEDEDSEMIKWNDTINTRYEEFYPAIFSRGKLIINKIILEENGDLKICFENGMRFEYFEYSSFGEEAWQIRRFDGETLTSYGDAFKVKDKETCERKTWLDTLEFPKIKVQDIPENIDIGRIKGSSVMEEKLKNHLCSLIGTQWSPDVMHVFDMPWRLQDSKKILMGIGDYNFPEESVEWNEFFEDDIGPSRMDYLFEEIRNDDLRIKAIKFQSNGDVILELHHGTLVEVFANETNLFLYR